MTQPKATRPRIPSTYGIPADAEGLLPYDFGQTAKDYLENAIFAFKPDMVLAWKVLYKDATRWRLED